MVPLEELHTSTALEIWLLWKRSIVEGKFNTARQSWCIVKRGDIRIMLVGMAFFLSAKEAGQSRLEV